MEMILQVGDDSSRNKYDKTRKLAHKHTFIYLNEYGYGWISLINLISIYTSVYEKCVDLFIQKCVAVEGRRTVRFDRLLLQTKSVVTYRQWVNDSHCPLSSTESA